MILAATKLQATVKQLEPKMKVCGRCRTNPRAASHRYCLSCKAAWMREWRKTHKEISPEQALKAKARHYANVYQRRGCFDRKPCRICGSDQAQKHHPDYTKPLLIDWLCRPCHLAEHRSGRDTHDESAVNIEIGTRRHHRRRKQKKEGSAWNPESKPG